MGFWDALGKSINDAVERQQEKQRRFESARDRLSSKSNEELLRIARDTSFMGASSSERMIAKALLIQRGAVRRK